MSSSSNLGWNDLLEPGEAGSGTGPRAGRSAADAEAALLADLNEPQQQAVRHERGPLLILAGAGSGKTRVITRRLAWLVATGRADPQECLAITFTNKAAGEMRERCERLAADGLVAGGVRGMWISTFHALGARILRREIEALGTHSRDFTIYDTTDRNQLLKEIVKELGYDTTRFAPGWLGRTISDAKQVRWAEEQGHALDEEYGAEANELVLRLIQAYEERMRKHNALDFDDLLALPLELFERHPGIRDAYAERFRYVLVDEYQDTNRVQYLLTRHLASRHGNLAVCGDPDQSIYAWRGADVRNILDFERDFAGAEVVKLEQNYRSTKTILAAAQSLIAHNSDRKPKELWSAGEEGARVRVLEAGDDDEEAGTVALACSEWVRSGRRNDEVGVFYRAKFQQRALERALRLAGVPYRITGGVEFYQRKEIRDLLAYLQLVANPADDVAFRRAVAAPPRGVGEKSLEVLAAFAAEHGLGLLPALSEENVLGAVRGRAKKSLGAFAGLFEELKTLGADSASVVLEAVLDETGYRDHLAGLADGSGEERIENVDEWLANARTYDRSPEARGLRGFLEEVALVSDTDDVNPEAGEEATGRVNLMTLHAAKGLEFPLVFVVGVEEELLPHARAVEEDDGRGGRGVQEERRLLYVGMTRARELLHLSWAHTRQQFGEQTWRRGSRFLEEIDPETLEGVEPEQDELDVLGAWDEEAAPELGEGDRVHHAHFGTGTIEKLVGQGANARVTVHFPRAGRKVLLLSYAKLERVDG